VVGRDLIAGHQVTGGSLYSWLRVVSGRTSPSTVRFTTRSRAEDSRDWPWSRHDVATADINVPAPPASTYSPDPP
jgi:hypothetical protein